MEPHDGIVNLWRRGQFLLIDPPVKPLNQLCTSNAHAPSSRRAGTVGMRTHPLVGMVQNFRGREMACCWAGLAPAVKHLLSEAGHSIVCANTQCEELSDPDFRLLHRHQPLDLDLLERFRVSERLLVRIDRRRVPPERVIGQLVMAWPSLRVLVLVARVDDAQQICDRMRSFTPNVALATGKHPFQGQGQVVVGTSGALGLVGIDQMDLVIVPNAIEGLRSKLLERLGDAHQARLVGIVDRQWTLSPYERDMAAAVFGMRHLVIPAPAQVERTVEVAFCNFVGGPQLSEAASYEELRRHGIWQYANRNQKVAAVANALRTGNLPHEIQTIRVTSTSNMNVMVLVDAVEHAAALLEYLPGWPVISTENLCKTGSPLNREITTLTSAKSDLSGIDHAIVIAHAAKHIDYMGIDVVIRADGGIGLPSLPLPDCLAVEPGQARPLLVVDFDDCHAPQLRARSRTRQEAYRAEGWVTVGEDQEQAALSRFLDDHCTHRRHG